MDLDLKDRVVLVSGASEGIGRAVGAAYAREGARVILSARRANRLQPAVDAISGDAEGIPADLTSAEEVEALINFITGATSCFRILMSWINFF